MQLSHLGARPFWLHLHLKQLAQSCTRDQAVELRNMHGLMLHGMMGSERSLAAAGPQVDRLGSSVRRAGDPLQAGLQPPAQR